MRLLALKKLIVFFSISSPIPGIELGIELNSGIDPNSDYEIDHIK